MVYAGHLTRGLTDQIALLYTCMHERLDASRYDQRCVCLLESQLSKFRRRNGFLYALSRLFPQLLSTRANRCHLERKIRLARRLIPSDVITLGRGGKERGFQLINPIIPILYDTP